MELPLSAIKTIEEIVNSSNDYVSLSQGVLKINGIPKSIKDYISTLMNTDLTDYYQSSYGVENFRNKLLEVIRKKFDTTITEQNLLPTHGAVGGLSLIFLSLLNPDDEIIIPEPYYPSYKTLAMASRAKIINVSTLIVPHEGKYIWDLNIETLEKVLSKKTKMLIFSNPWNPTGMVVDPNRLKQIIKWCEENKIFLVVDEAFRDFVYDTQYESTISLVSKSQWLISVSSFSKSMAMSGWRIGFIVFPERLYKIFVNMQDALLNCLNNIAQYAALFALEHPELTQEFYNILMKRRTLTLNMLEPLIKEGILETTPPKGTFFTFIKTKYSDATPVVMDLLNKAKVGTIPGAVFGQSVKPFFRLCFARDETVLKEGLNRVISFFK